MPQQQTTRRERGRPPATRPRPVLTPAALVLLVLLALGAAACAGSGDGGSRVASLSGSSSGGRTTTTPRNPEDAALAYARCMRQHGVDMPDPQVDSSGKTRLEIRGGKLDKRKVLAADSACGSLLKSGLGAGRQLDPAAQDAMVHFARCMRQHGIDMPDPTPGQGLRIQRSKAVDPDSSKFRQAEQACNHLLDQLKPSAGGRK